MNKDGQGDEKLQQPITRARVRGIREKDDQIAHRLMIAIEENMKEDGNPSKLFMIQYLNLEQPIEQMGRRRNQGEVRTEPTTGGRPCTYHQQQRLLREQVVGGHLPTQSHQEGPSDPTRMNLNETLRSMQQSIEGLTRQFQGVARDVEELKRGVEAPQ
ncbi:hypothetical protein M9H77_17534 [Catharanthus roseus]|uniref:Uncharacterized protein n=1 Tax=Catharanthus roseus TaxID=4058 RepID=A0ACC0B4U8_CATRO|nr:hypothetical protein M9H77_17534 [Catharanthus roseus]